LYLQAEKWSKLPSEILFIKDWVDANAVNQAVWQFGSALEVALAEAEEKGKSDKDKKARRQAVITSWLGGSVAKQYRDPGNAEVAAKRI
jgi:hypothetical protein